MLETETIYPGGNPPTEKKGYSCRLKAIIQSRGL